MASRRRTVALDVYGHADGTRWLSPDMDRVPNLVAMRLLLQQWIAEDARLAAPAGRWASQRNADDRVIGGAILLPLPPGNEDLEIGWQLHPSRSAWSSRQVATQPHPRLTQQWMRNGPRRPDFRAVHGLPGRVSRQGDVRW